MRRVTLFKKFMMPCGLCAVPVIARSNDTAQEKEKPCCEEAHQKKLVKPSELPIYATDDTLVKLGPCKERQPTMMEDEIGKIRKVLQSGLTQYRNIADSVTSKIDTGVEHSRVLLDYMRDEENILPRIGAVGIGGLTGLILGLRGGKFKKLLYMSSGAGAAAAVCYPKQAGETLESVKHYAVISYNFVYGVRPGDGNELKLESPLPSFKLPTSFSEFLELVLDATSAAASAAGALTQKAYKAVTEKKEDS